MKLWKGMPLLVGMIFLVLACFVLPVMAEEAVRELEKKEEGEKQAHKQYELETMTVTAEKREEDIQEVPVSISALSEIQIEDARIVSIIDLAANIPNLDIIPIGGSRFYTTTSIRGIGTTFIGDPAVGLYVDGVPYSDEHSYNIQLFDIERIEVLRGPQGVLYGKNTQGGVINIVTRKPGNKFMGKASVGIGNYKSREYRLGISCPIIEDRLFFGLAGVKMTRDGFVDNTFLNTNPDDRNGIGGRAGLRWTPSDRLDVMLDLNMEENKDGSMIMTPMDQNDPFKVTWDFDGHEDTKFNGQSLRVAYEASMLMLTSITARREWTVDFLVDYDYSPADIMIGGMKKDNTQWSQEFRCQSLENGSALKWLTGAYYGHKDYYSELPYQYGADAGPWAGAKENQEADMLNKDYALFGQTTYTFFDKLDLTAGLRYGYEEKEMKRSHYFDMGGVIVPVAPDMDRDGNWSEWAPKINVAYRPSNHLMAYVGAAKGYKSGGFSYPEDDPALVEFEPEVSWNYETGLKSSWLNNRLVANAALFYNDIDEMQVRRQTGVNTVTVVNAKKAVTKGFEVELMARPAQGFDLIAGFGYTDAEYDDFIDPVNGIDYTGKKCLGVPKYNYNLTAQYRHLTGFMGRLEWQGIEDRYFDEANTRKESYSLVNGRIGYETEHFDIHLWAKNIFDEQYFHIGWPDTGGGNLWTGSPGDPRTFGIMVTGRF